MQPRYHLYFDDSGSRQPDHKPNPVRDDGMDYFALGGILINEERIPELIEKHRNFSRKWNLTYPLHSTSIRGSRKEFSWLKKDETLKAEFLFELEQMIVSLPIIGLACVIHRPGYVKRYSDKHQGKPWLLCKTAFTILTERAAKFCKRNNAQLEIFFEQSGPKEDQDIKNYMRALKREGMPFDQNNSQLYNQVEVNDFRSIVLGEPREKTKKTPMIQIADLVLYPMVKAGYEETYEPFLKLRNAKQIIDVLLLESEIPSQGIKYSCFDFKNKKAQKN
ncbi:MAG: DUF3800 domain-containing protein [Alphaproteobacteria bacterium]|nr:DUF3800 domain-containing protein [Alphaproteobacteria bacterium]